MAIITGTIVGTGQSIQIDIPTIRIPELPPVTLPFDSDDKIALYDDSENKTVYTGVQDFRDYIITGGNVAGLTPILQGADLEIVITPEIAANIDSGTGLVRVNVPALEEKTFTLERRGTGPLLTSEFLTYPSGGFELSDDTAQPVAGDVFIAHIYELAGGMPSPTTTNSGGFLNGIATISESTELTTVHYKKLVHVAGNTNKVTVTLMDVADAYAANLVIPIETNISNQYQTRVSSRGGQSIYFGNTSQTEIILGQSEYLWLMAGADGWYVMNPSDGILNVGQPLFDYVQRFNTKIATGQLVNKADVPRLMAFLTSNPSLVVSESDWQNTREDASLDPAVNDWVYTLRGKFADYDSTQIRFPDLQELAFTGLKNIGGSDANRANNTPGGIQKDGIRAHGHDISSTNSADGGSDTVDVKRGSAIGSVNTRGRAGANKTIGMSGGNKTTVKNVGLLPLIRI